MGNTYDLYQYYVEDIEKIPEVLNDEKNKLLIEEYRNAKTELEKKVVKDRLIEGNLRLVLFIVEKYVTRNDDKVMDAVQAGNMGLMDGISHAVIKFDTKGKGKVSSYITYYIKKYVKEYMDSTKYLTRIPTSAIRLDKKSEYGESDIIGRDLQTAENAKQMANNNRFSDYEMEGVEDKDFDLEELVVNKVWEDKLRHDVADEISNSGLSDLQKKLIKDRFGIGTDRRSIKSYRQMERENKIYRTKMRREMTKAMLVLGSRENLISLCSTMFD